MRHEPYCFVQGKYGYMPVRRITKEPEQQGVGMETATGDTLTKWATLYAVDRAVSVQWERGYVFQPRFSVDGRLMSIYEEGDTVLRHRILDKVRGVQRKVEDDFRRALGVKA